MKSDWKHTLALALWIVLGLEMAVLLDMPSYCMSNGDAPVIVASAEVYQLKIQEPAQDKKPVVPDRAVAASKPRYHAKYPYRAIIERVSRRHGIDPALVMAIIKAESGYNPEAVSSNGARGLMQLMPATAAALGVEDIFNPEHNIEAGVRYFRHLLDRCDGDVELALAAYNAGIEKVSVYQGVPPYGATRRFIEKVNTFYRIYSEQMAPPAEKL